MSICIMHIALCVKQDPNVTYLCVGKYTFVCRCVTILLVALGERVKVGRGYWMIFSSGSFSIL